MDHHFRPQPAGTDSSRHAIDEFSAGVETDVEVLSRDFPTVRSNAAAQVECPCRLRHRTRDFERMAVDPFLGAVFNDRPMSVGPAFESRSNLKKFGQRDANVERAEAGMVEPAPKIRLV